MMVLALAGCTSSGGDPRPAPTPEPSADPRWVPLPEVPTSPEAYVGALVDAWRHGSTDEVARYATDAAAESLLALDATEVRSPTVGCFTHAGSTACEVVTIDMQSLTLDLRLRRVRAGRERAVTQVTLLGAMPTTDDEYAAALVRAWADDDRRTALRLAKPEVVDVLFERGTGEGWRHSGTDAAAGSRFYFYEGPGDEVLMLTFGAAEVNLGETQAIRAAEFRRP